MMPYCNYLMTGDTATTTLMPWQDFSANTTTTSADYNSFYDVYVPGRLGYKEVMAAMARVQGFRPGDWHWFGTKLLDRVKLGRLNRLSFDVTKSEQKAKAPRLQTKERKRMFKPRATSCRKWTTGRPRK